MKKRETLSQKGTTCLVFDNDFLWSFPASGLVLAKGESQKMNQLETVWIRQSLLNAEQLGFSLFRQLRML